MLRKNTARRIALKDRILSAIAPSTYPNISAKKIMKEFFANSSFDEWGDLYFTEGLYALTESVQKEAQLSVGAKSLFISNCFNRLSLRKDILQCLKESPEIAEFEIKRPIFITGLPRTGTTLLQRLLARDPNARVLYEWELWPPRSLVTPKSYSSDPRYLIAKARAKKNKGGHLSVIHDSNPIEPTECNSLFQVSFASSIYTMYYDVPDYLKWLRSCDRNNIYAFYKEQLKIMSYNWEPRHWVLKAPAHLANIDMLTSYFPDSTIIQTHRDPKEVLSSHCSLISNARKISSLNVRPDYVGRQQLKQLAEALNTAIQVRRENAPKNIFDISYKELLKNPIDLVKKIYCYFGYEYTVDFDREMQAYLLDNPKNRYGAHEHSLAEYSLTRSAVNSEFERYQELYQQYL